MPKIPQTPEEYLVWPPLGGGVGVFIGATAVGVGSRFHGAVLTQPDFHYLHLYLFSMLMGFGLALPLHGRYWLGFAWIAVLAYLLSYVLHFFDSGLIVDQFLIVTGCLVLMFTCQSLVLFGKRRTVHTE